MLDRQLLADFQSNQAAAVRKTGISMLTALLDQAQQ